MSGTVYCTRTTRSPRVDSVAYGTDGSASCGAGASDGVGASGRGQPHVAACRPLVRLVAVRRHRQNDARQVHLLHRPKAPCHRHRRARRQVAQRLRRAAKGHVSPHHAGQRGVGVVGDSYLEDNRLTHRHRFALDRQRDRKLGRRGSRRRPGRG